MDILSFILSLPQKALSFVKEAWWELRKVTWLAKKDVVRATIGVSVIVIVVAIFVSSMDWLFSRIVKALIGGR